LTILDDRNMVVMMMMMAMMAMTKIG